MVTFHAVPPRLSVSSRALSFTLNQDDIPLTQVISVANLGGGDLPFTAAIEPPQGGGWLTIATSAPTASASTPAAITVTADPTGLVPGTYTAVLAIRSADPAQFALLPVTFIVRSAKALVVTARGFAFRLQTNGVTLPQSLAILNTGTGPMNWTVSSDASWLSLSTPAGTAVAGSPASDVVASVKAGGLTAGQYSAEIRVTAPNALNSPQLLRVTLDVVPPGGVSVPQVDTSTLVFVADAGGLPPAQQQFVITNPTSSPLSFRTAFSQTSASAFVVLDPSEATIGPFSSTRVTAKISSTSLPPGLNSSVISLFFPGLSAISINANLLLRDTPVCTPSTLLAFLASPAANLSAAAGLPTPIRARLLDNCGTPFTLGLVSVSFSSRDPAVALQSLGDGRWEGTWIPQAPSPNPVLVVLNATDGNGSSASTSATVTLPEKAGLPYISAVTDAFGFLTRRPVAPGAWVTILGTAFAPAASSIPGNTDLVKTLGGTQVLLNGQPIGIFLVSPTQIFAQIPFETPVNAQVNLVVRSGPSASFPFLLDTVAAQPSIFTSELNGAGQGIIVRTGGVANPSNPARPGDSILIACNGLGPVSPPLQSGIVTPPSPASLAINRVSVRIGGLDAEVTFACMQPGIVGLYQVATRVPLGVPLGDAVPVTVSVAGQTSAPVTMAIK